MANETEAVRLRDQRKPGHLWVDNEIYDVFGDGLRQDGISVYTTLARLCYGVSVSMGLRQMATHARMSKDTFARNLKRVIAFGLVLERKGATRQSPSIYTLVDVKELTQKYLRAAMDEKKRTAAESVSGVDSASAQTLADLLSIGEQKGLAAPLAVQPQKCLTLRHSPDLAGSEAIATEVSQNDPGFATEVSQAVRHPLRQDTRHKDTRATPQPPASGGPAAPVSGELEEFLETRGLPVEPDRLDAARLEAQLDLATIRVMRGSGFVVKERESAVQRAIREALRLRCGQAGCSPEVAAESAIELATQYRDLDRQGLLRVRYGWVKFFEEGHWIHGGWSLDNRELRMQREARIGT